MLKNGFNIYNCGIPLLENQINHIRIPNLEKEEMDKNISIYLYLETLKHLFECLYLLF
jgi:hypothetical protein